MTTETKKSMDSLPAFDNHDKRIKYYKLLLEMDTSSIPHYELPNGFHIVGYSDGDKEKWIEIEKSAKEFDTDEKGQAYWDEYYGGRECILSNRMFFVQTDDGEKVATSSAYYDIYGIDKTDPGWLHWVAVRRDYQGKGLSKPLISFILEKLKELGYKRLVVSTQTTSWVACKIYLDMGFRPVPQNVVENLKGWEIVKRLTGHPALSDFKSASNEDILA